MEKNKGIVLKTYVPQKCKLAVLDQELGKIMAVPNRQTIGNGAFINYYVQPRQNMHFIYDIELIDLPMALAKEDLLFVHHILELCYYFMPLNSCSHSIFNQLIFLYTSPVVLSSMLLKKVFLFQLFTKLGLYPEGPQFQTPQFHFLATASIDTIPLQKIDLIIEQELDTWLLNCISLHPCAKNFKTIQFLHTNRVL